MNYSPKDIEPKWQDSWQKSKIYEASSNSTKPKRYVLEYFPYPSGAAMHVGHVRNYTIGDVIARVKRMQGFNVLHPMGWDAFGLPAENYAIKTGTSPRIAIDENTAKFKKQLTQMGFSYDWSREIDSTDPKYYRWTQWFFLLLFRRGLAYQKESEQWWCDQCKTVLANEQVVEGKCWRHDKHDDPIVGKKSLKQWFFKITEYADRLLQDLDSLEWSSAIKSMQSNWIGKSEGVVIKSVIKGTDIPFEAYDSVPQTYMAQTFAVIAPEHKRLKEIIRGKKEEPAVLEFIEKIQEKKARKQFDAEADFEGVFTGCYIEDPYGTGDLPLWVASFVVADYGTGMVACSAHDERDFAFAKKYNIPLKIAMLPADPVEAERVKNFEYCFSKADEGILLAPEKFSGRKWAEVRADIIQHLVDSGIATKSVQYKIRDWLISRQRYWGAPIPIIHCAHCGPVPVPEADLPVQLPELDDFKPVGDGRSPLAKAQEWLSAPCPTCGKPGERETDTMDGFACSSWYFMRFADPHNANEFADKHVLQYWSPVDDYIGGAEHAVMHLLYARFWTKVAYDAGYISFNEPFTRLRNQGMILAPDGQKMSKSKGNTIEPDTLIAQGYGADSIRLMELFIGPWNQSANWSTEGIGGCHRFLNRVWNLVIEVNEVKNSLLSNPDAELLRIQHTLIQKVTEQLEALSFNTAIASLMEALNELYTLKKTGIHSAAWLDVCKVFIQLLAPFSPHITEELWQIMGNEQSVHTTDWPTYDPALTAKSTMTIAVQINGKIRAEIDVDATATKDEILQMAKENENVQRYIANTVLKKEIYVPGKLVSLVI
jgi:leucyl-tRNA synthetase